MAHHITNGEAELANILSRVEPGTVVLVDFFAQWCGPCRAIAPKLDTLKGILLLKVDIEEPGNADLTNRFKIRAMPTFVWIVDGKGQERLEGADWTKIQEITNNLL